MKRGAVDRAKRLEEFPILAAHVLAMIGLGLAACDGEPRTVVAPQPQTAMTVIVPPGATVVCPSRHTAVPEGWRLSLLNG